MKKTNNPNDEVCVFAERLSMLMRKNKVKQTTLGKHLNVSRQAVSTYVDGSVFPNMKNLLKICQFFGVSSDYMLGLSVIPNVVDERYFEELEGIIHKTKKYEEEKTKGENHLIKCFNKMILNIRVFPKEIFSDEFNERINHLDSLLTAYNERDEEWVFDVVKGNFYEFAQKYDSYYKTAIRKYLEAKKG